MNFTYRMETQATSPTSTRNAASAPTKNRGESLETYNIEKTIGGRTMTDLRSGCLQIKNMGMPTARANFPSVPSDCVTVPTFEWMRIAAVMRSTPILAVSEG